MSDFLIGLVVGGFIGLSVALVVFSAAVLVAVVLAAVAAVAVAALLHARAEIRMLVEQRRELELAALQANAAAATAAAEVRAAYYWRPSLGSPELRES